MMLTTAQLGGQHQHQYDTTDASPSGSRQHILISQQHNQQQQQQQKQKNRQSFRPIDPESGKPLPWIVPPIRYSIPLASQQVAGNQIYEPIRRCHHSATLVGNQIYVFGGYGGVGIYFNEIEVLDLDTMTWSRLEPMSGMKPSPRRSHSATLIGNKICILGGRYCNTYYNDFYTFDVETLEWKQHRIKGTPPSPRAGHTSFAVGNELFIFGGERYELDRQESVLFSDLYILNIETMECREVKFDTDKPGAVPPQRVYHTFSKIGNKAYLFGGMGNNLQRLNDMWCLEPLDSPRRSYSCGLKWGKCETTGDIPHAHETHTASVIDHYIYIIGGKENVELKYFENFILVFDTDSMKWKRYATKIPQRGRHSATVYNGRIYIHGGGDNTISFLNDTRVLFPGLGTYHRDIANLGKDILVTEECGSGSFLTNPRSMQKKILPPIVPSLPRKPPFAEDLTKPSPMELSPSPSPISNQQQVFDSLSSSSASSHKP